MLSHWCLFTAYACTLFSGWSHAIKLSRSRRTIIGSYPLCPLGCESCSSSNGCVTCASGYFLDIQRYGARQLGRCVQKCPDGFYGLAKKDFGICRKCPVPHCASCTDVPMCMSCVTPYILYEGRCISHCPDKLHYAAYAKQCLPEVDCIMSDWTDWDVCKRNGQTCGYKYGTQSRKRLVLQAASPGGKPCELAKEVRRCRLLYRYCSDVITNSSEPRKMPCQLSKRERKRKRRGRSRRRHLRKFCRRKRKRKTKKKHRKQTNRGKGKSTRKNIEERKGTSLKTFNKFYYDVPNLKTNQIDALLTKR